MGLGLSEKRIVIFSRSGRSKLVGVPFADPERSALEASVHSQKLVLDVDDRYEALGAGGKLRIRISRPSAAAIVQALSARAAPVNARFTDTRDNVEVIGLTTSAAPDPGTEIPPLAPPAAAAAR